MTHSFDLLGLAEPLRLALKAENYVTPTPIQLEAIPILIQGRDLLGSLLLLCQQGQGNDQAGLPE